MRRSLPAFPPSRQAFPQERLRPRIGEARKAWTRGGKENANGEWKERLAAAPPAILSTFRATASGAREQRLGLVNLLRCDVRFIEVAGFKKKPPNKANQGLQRPIVVDFGQVGAGGPWVLTSLHAQTPLGNAAIDLNRVTLSGRPPV